MKPIMMKKWKWASMDQPAEDQAGGGDGQHHDRVPGGAAHEHPEHEQQRQVQQQESLQEHVPFLPGPFVEGVAPRQVREQPCQSEPLPRFVSGNGRDHVTIDAEAANRL